MVVSKEDENYAEGIKNYININEVLLKRLSTSYKSLFMEMNAVSVRMKEISEIYDQLNTVSVKTHDVILNLIIRIKQLLTHIKCFANCQVIGAILIEGSPF